MKQASAVLVFLLLSSVFAQAQKEFKIVDATERSWAGGMPQSGHGTSYTVRVVLLSKKAITFEDAWIGDKYVTTKSDQYHVSNDHHATKGDTVSVTFALNVMPQRDPVPEPKPVTKEKPCVYKGAALLGYTVGGKERYRTISAFTRLAPANYP
ncbi:MAG: hypothetical protein JWO03_3807 [Bacteroidetes bacterium]|nr:hypothetical protein [Bacteroidota bacterium]